MSHGCLDAGAMVDGAACKEEDDAASGASMSAVVAPGGVAGAFSAQWVVHIKVFTELFFGCDSFGEFYVW